MSNNNPNLSNLDEYQMANRTFDPTKDAIRVTVVDGLEIKADNINIPELKLPNFEQIVVKELEVKEIKVPEIIKQIEIKEVPVIIKEVEVKEVQIPVVVTEFKIIEIEKPVIVKETEVQGIEQKNYNMPMIVKVCLITQTLAMIGILITNVVK